MLFFHRSKLIHSVKSDFCFIDWNGNYDGKVADIHFSVDNNGRKEEMNIKLDKEDDIFVDVGANIGIYSLYAASVNDAVKVFCN